MTNLEKAGKKIVLHVHDEVVVEVDEDMALHAKADIQEIMKQGPEWMKDVPLDSEAIITKEYTK
jgi:DNA polymerase